ncbi:S8 family serine peptidase [Terrimonas sp. NA20]|uniref:S8 family serine peptidase n=1 Tax=Terrimonas ginsenosidimutans TaxID=2908004 RepID=A0ABS9KZQ8_9BACT|nr:S8 family serine peptidase [Terrimonas ginsenosidimutans]MCG2617857.1 S8 family serine peptidase [Terrimonas ginsenosidimutans]
MRMNPIIFLAAILFAGTSIAQDSSAYSIALRSGTFIPPKHVLEEKVATFNQLSSRSNLSRYMLIQFDKLPDESEKQALAASGIELLEYIPHNTYTATVKGTMNAQMLRQVRVRSLITLTPEQKMTPQLLSGMFPVRSLKVPGKIDLWISYPKTINAEDLKRELLSMGVEIIPTAYDKYRVIAVRIAKERVKELAGLGFVEYVQPVPGEDVLLNDKSKVISRANVLQSSLPGGRALNGEGVVMGVGDNATLLFHTDFTGRVIDRMPLGFNYHGMHVAGTMAGGGLLQERYKGYAPKAQLISQQFSNILAYSPAYVFDHGMVITNNSYGNVVDECATFGVYDLYSRIMDDISFLLPNLQNVFAAGNSGQMTCAPYTSGYRTILGAYQSAKNTISVGNTTELSVLSPASSRGPAADGRIKPEIVAQGQFVRSTFPINLYGYSSGTSMAAPAVSGGLALLYQRYRQLHSNANPMASLMKALLCNGATDIGNPGPDYFYGFGQMNLLRSVTMLEKNNYIEAAVNPGATNTHTISIPSGANIAQLKVMLYWNDAPATMLSASSLVNDLDLEVGTPASTTVLPYVLNPAPAGAANNATQGADHRNNIEQVVINNPAAGNYDFRVTGTTIPLTAAYNYVLVYDTIPVSTTIVYPVGGEYFSAGDSIYINWDSYGNPANTFSLQYSTDGGATWPVTIEANVAAGQRQFKWFVPSGNTSQARVRVVQNGTGLQSVSNNFVVLGTPSISLAPAQCEGYIAIQWAAVPDATDYEVTMLRGDEMVPVAVTASTSYTFGGLSKDSVYYVAVRARINGSPGWRSAALAAQPNTGTCAGNISNNDLKIDALVSPSGSGRRFTSTSLSATTPVTIRIKNLDDAPTSGNIAVRYVFGAGPAVNETITAPAIAAGGTYAYTFTTTADLSAVGEYPLTVSITYPGDVITANDTVKALIRQLDNPVMDLTTDFIDNMESAPMQSHTTRQTGLTGLDRYDFVGSTIWGRIRTFVNSGIAYSGNRALTLDADRTQSPATVDSLTATFNLSAYNITTDDIRLDFQYKHHGQLPDTSNKVWIRGSDTSPWVLAYDLYANQQTAGVFRRSASIELRTLLLANAQLYSSSLQVRFGQYGNTMTADNESAAGYTFDDIHLYTVTNDIQMLAVDTPVVASCGLNAAVPVKIRVKNSAAATLTSIPVRLQVDGGAIISEVIASIAGNSTISYDFSATANLGTPGVHSLRIWVDLPSDTYRENDTAYVQLINSPVIATFPYIQNFEADNGFWYSGGLKSSWQYGTPLSSNIRKAASGTKAWKTSLTGNYNDGEHSYLYSPCFDITGMTNPTLSFSLALDIEDCNATLCDAAYMEYSADGKTWTRLGSSGSGTNWYNKNYSGNQLWSVQNYTRWHVATIPLPTGYDRLRLRFVMAADPYASREGIAVDDIHIYDKQYGIYDGPPANSNTVTVANVTGSNWIHFTDGGEVIASVNPAGQNMGSTAVQGYVHMGAVRNASNQYYHDRNITIKPTQTTLTDSVTVRFYFTDQETELLLNAGGCGLCTKPGSAYELGVSKYNNTNKSLENGSLADNVNGRWQFISNAVKVPYDNGYYAEFRVKDFSEFWLNNGGPGNNQALPVELISFTATKAGSGDVKIDWTTASEISSSHYEIELAKGNTALNQQTFEPLAKVLSENNPNGARYSFLDRETNKSGVRYYRLKMVDQNGSFRYSAVRPVVFDEEISWQLYPNPSQGMFNLICQAPAGEKIDIIVHDVTGRQIKRLQQPANGFVQKIPVDLSGDDHAKGVYLLDVKAGGKSSSFRMVKL